MSAAKSIAIVLRDRWRNELREIATRLRAMAAANRQVADDLDGMAAMVELSLHGVDEGRCERLARGLYELCPSLRPS
jgi:conjugal transfer/entry exclusion protein